MEIGKLESLEIGKWEVGNLGSGKLESWKVESCKVESWKVGNLESWKVESSKTLNQVARANFSCSFALNFHLNSHQISSIRHIFLKKSVRFFNFLDFGESYHEVRRDLVRKVDFSNV